MANPRSKVSPESTAWARQVDRDSSSQSRRIMQLENQLARLQSRVTILEEANPIPVPIPSSYFAAGVAASLDEAVLQVRRLGGRVYMDGKVRFTTSSASDVRLLFAIPDDFAPDPIRDLRFPVNQIINMGTPNEFSLNSTVRILSNMVWIETQTEAGDHIDLSPVSFFPERVPII